MLGKIWKKALLFILIVACLFNIVRKVVRKTSLREELQATLDYFNIRNQKTIENIVENNQIINSLNTQSNTERQTIQNNNQVTIENNQMIQQPPANNQQQVIPNNQENQQSSTINNPNNQENQQPGTTNNPSEQQYIQQNDGQTTQDLLPITQSEIEQNRQARMRSNVDQ